jgi:hypothetical protein
MIEEATIDLDGAEHNIPLPGAPQETDEERAARLKKERANIKAIEAELAAMEDETDDETGQ